MQDLRRRRQDLLRGKLSNRDRYVQKAEEIDRLIRQAVIHYQFEAIHPFDGRTAQLCDPTFSATHRSSTAPECPPPRGRRLRPLARRAPP